MNSISSAGLTSRPSSRKSASCATHASPSWNVIDRAPGGRGGAADHEPGEEHGEEAGAVDRVARRRRRGRRTRPTPPGTGRPRAASRGAGRSRRARRPRARPRRRSPARTPPARSRPARRSPECWTASMQPITSRIAIGSLTPDSPSSVRASRRRSVDPRRTANTAAASVAATVEPSISASSPVSSSISHIATIAVRPGGQDRAERRERDRLPDHRADLGPAAGQAALVQDQRQRHDRRRLRGVVVLEVDDRAGRRSR